VNSPIQDFCLRSTSPATKGFLLDEARQLAHKQYHGSQLIEEVNRKHIAHTVILQIGSDQKIMFCLPASLFSL
jgi:hypothetical protein